MRFERLTLSICQEGSHSLAAATVLFGQSKAPGRIAVNFPRALTGKGEIDYSHESGNIFCGIADKKSDFMGEGTILPDAPAQLSHQRFTG